MNIIKDCQNKVARQKWTYGRLIETKFLSALPGCLRVLEEADNNTINSSQE